MSVAVSLPAVSPPKSTDCVIDAGSRKSSSESTPWKPGRNCDGLPIVDVFTAAMNIGNSSPGSHTCGWRIVPRIDRRASPAACASAWRLPIRTSPRSATAVAVTRCTSGSVAGGSLEATTGGVGEHVVEAGRVELDVLDGDARVLEGAQRRRQRRRAARQADGDVAGLGGARSSPKSLEHLGGLDLLVERHGDDERVGADAVLERLRVALAHDAAAVDDGDAAGQLVGLLEVLRREEHRGALGVEPAHLLPQRERDWWGRGRWWARRGRARSARARATAPGRGGAACHRSRCRRDGRRRPSGRPGRAARRRGGRPRPRVMPCSTACSRTSSRPVISGSMAASCSATPIDAAHRARLPHHVVPGHARRAGGGLAAAW